MLSSVGSSGGDVMTFDVSKFAEIGAFLFSSVKSLYQMLNFNFGNFTLNGWALLLGCAVFIMVVKFIARLFD